MGILLNAIGYTLLHVDLCKLKIPNRVDLELVPAVGCAKVKFVVNHRISAACRVRNSGRRLMVMRSRS